MGPALAVCAFFLTAGLALLVSCANLFFRDVKYVVQVLLTFGIFFTPVFFEPEMFGALGARVMMLNPLAPIMEGLRLSVVLDHNLLDALVVQGRHGAVLAWIAWYLAYSAAAARSWPSWLVSWCSTGPSRNLPSTCEVEWLKD